MGDKTATARLSQNVTYSRGSKEPRGVDTGIAPSDVEICVRGALSTSDEVPR